MSREKELRTEKHIINSNDPYFNMLMCYCRRAKNLYNKVTYMAREEVKETGKLGNILFNYPKILREDIEHPDFMSMPSVDSASSLIQMVQSTWSGYFRAIKDYKKSPEKYTGRPQKPGYLPKLGKYVCSTGAHGCRVRKGILVFHKGFHGFTIENPQCINRPDFKGIVQARFIPHKNNLAITCEVIYEIEKPEPKEDNGRYIAIDLGVNNLATVCNNISAQAFAINGRPLKSIIHRYKEIIDEFDGKPDRASKDKVLKATEKRNRKVEDYMHKSSRYIIDWCNDHDISTIVVGKTKGWKRSEKGVMLTQIPHNRLIEMLQYKAKENGITVKVIDESFTSGTSFLDEEMPVKKYYDESRRIHRGMFVANDGREINADLNARYQIMRKVIPVKYDGDYSLHPVKVNLG